MAPFATVSRRVCAVAASTIGDCGVNRPSWKRRLVRVLHREPAVVAVPRIGVDAEAELLDIELERLVLIADIQTGHRHPGSRHPALMAPPGTSVSSALSISSASCRRFSETAIVRFGPVGGAEEAGAAPARARCGRLLAGAGASPGLSPVTSRKVRPKVPRLFQPVWNAISVIGRSVSRSSAVARSMRRVEQVAVRRDAEGLLEGSREVGLGDAAHARQPPDRPLLVRGGVHPVLGAQQAAQQRRILAGALWLLSGRAPCSHEGDQLSRRDL